MHSVFKCSRLRWYKGVFQGAFLSLNKALFCFFVFFLWGWGNIFLLDNYRMRVNYKQCGWNKAEIFMWVRVSKCGWHPLNVGEFLYIVYILSKGLFIWGETSHLGDETSHLNEILFIPHLYEKNTPPEWNSFHPSSSACLLLSSYVTFIVYLSFCFYSNSLIITNKIFDYKFYKVNCTFSTYNFKTKPSLN